VAPVVDAGVTMTVKVNQPISFAGQYSDPGTQDTHQITWDFGDGSLTVSGSLFPTHVYNDTGTYTVSLTIIDDDKGETSDTLEVRVEDQKVYLPIVIGQ